MVDLTTPCIPGIGKHVHRGYVYVRDGGQVRRAHRLAWENAFGPIPGGLVVDHACHNADQDCLGGDGCAHRACVNPSHLELVTPAENSRRGRVNAAKTECPSGHPYSEENTHIERLAGGKMARRCLTCRRQRDAKRRAARKAA